MELRSHSPLCREPSQEDDVHIIRKALAQLVLARRLTASQSESFQRDLAEAMTRAASERARLLRLLDAVLVAIDGQLVSSPDLVELEGHLIAVHWSRLLAVIRKDDTLEGLDDAKIKAAFRTAASDLATGVSGYQVRATFGPGDRRRALVLDLEKIRTAVGRAAVPFR